MNDDLWDSVYGLGMGIISVVVSMWTQDAGVVMSNPACVTVKTPLTRKAAGKDLIKSTSLEKTGSLISCFC